MSERLNKNHEVSSTNKNRWVSGRNAILLLLLWLALAIALQAVDIKLADIAGGETKLDLRFGYDLSTVRSLFDSYGEYGRSLYVWNLAVDTLMPLFLALATILFVALAFRSRPVVMVLAVVPIAFFLADVVENIFLVTLVTSFPNIDPGLVTVASNVTRPKLVAAMLTYAILIVSVVIVVARQVKARFGQTK